MTNDAITAARARLATAVKAERAAKKETDAAGRLLDCLLNGDQDEAIPISPRVSLDKT